MVCGDPDPAHVSTSYVERQKLTMRMSVKRFARLSNGFSKKIENHEHAVAMYYVFYTARFVWTASRNRELNVPGRKAAMGEGGAGVGIVNDYLSVTSSLRHPVVELCQG